jgi:hypothetical protein
MHEAVVPVSSVWPTDVVRVQRWVMSSLLLATAFLFAGGLAGAYFAFLA